MMLDKNISTFIGCDSEYEDAKIVLFGAPYDSTTSFRPGTRFGPPAIRNESFGIETYSPYQDKDLEDCRIFDSGDMELCFGSSEQALADIEERASVILADGKLPLLLGGEHLVTLGAVRAAARQWPDLHIIHFDAHADLPAERGYEVMLTVRVQDEQGHPILRENRAVAFTVDGPALIVATDNGDLMETTPYSSPALPLWHGQASVVIRLTGEEGEIRISACAEGLAPAALILNAQ